MTIDTEFVEIKNAFDDACTAARTEMARLDVVIAKSQSLDLIRPATKGHQAIENAIEFAERSIANVASTLPVLKDSIQNVTKERKTSMCQATFNSSVISSHKNAHDGTPEHGQKVLETSHALAAKMIEKETGVRVTMPKATR